MTSISPQNDLMPLYLSSIAGASTCIGAGVVFLYPRGKPVGADTMAFSLALAGSVMVTVSAISIGPEALQTHNGEWIPIASRAFTERILSFVAGCAVYFALSWCAFPEPEEILGFEKEDDAGGHKEGGAVDNGGCEKKTVMELTEVSFSGSADSGDLEAVTPLINQSSSSISDKGDTVALRSRKDRGSIARQNSSTFASTSAIATPSISHPPTAADWTTGRDLQTPSQKRAWRVAILLFLSLLAHNFPEGLAVAASAVRSPKLGITVTIGILIHNIPEGIAIAVPCLAARPDRPWLAFVLASVSGLAEPLGAFVALLILRRFVDTDQGGDLATVLSLENVLAFVAGVMVTVAVYELFPEAWRQRVGGKMGEASFWWGTICGFVIMVLTEFYMDA